MCHVVLVLKSMSNFELEFYDRLQYWHRLEEKVVGIMKKSVLSECRVQNFELSGGKQGTLDDMYVRPSAGLSVPVTPNPSLSVLA